MDYLSTSFCEARLPSEFMPPHFWRGASRGIEVAIFSFSETEEQSFVIDKALQSEGYVELGSATDRKLPAGFGLQRTTVDSDLPPWFGFRSSSANEAENCFVDPWGESLGPTVMQKMTRI